MSNTRTRGFTLVELMVAVAVALVMTLAITAVLIHSEARKRTATALNAADQNGAYASFVLERTLRSAGSGFMGQWDDLAGCLLQAADANAQLLPRSVAAPPPFDALPLRYRLAPALVAAGGNGSDTLIVMAGSSGFSAAATPVALNSHGAASVRLANTLGINGGDLLLLTRGAGADCGVTQAAPEFVGGASQTLELGGAYFHDPLGGSGLAAYTGAGAYALGLGNADTNPPQFQLIGVGANQALASLDLLRLSGRDEAVPLADGVVALKALYGVDADGNGRLESWQSPGAAPWDLASLTDGSAQAGARLKQVFALRVGLILRTALADPAEVAPPSLTLFDDLPGLQHTRRLDDDERRYRHRVVEFTVPLRNAVIQSPPT